MQQTAAKRFLLTSAGLTLLLFVGYYAAFFYQLGARVKAEWWVPNMLHYKDYVATTTPSPRILVAGGSNVLFGFDSAVLERRLGLPVVNLGTHAALSPEFQYFRVLDHAKPGDRVVIPLEPGVYFRGLTDWFASNMSAWGWDDYLSRLSLPGLLGFVTAVPPLRVLEGVTRQTGQNPVLPPDKVVLQVQRALADPSLRPTIVYSHMRLNRYGDLLVDQGPHPRVVEKFRRGLPIYRHNYQQRPFSTVFVDALDKLHALAKQRGFSMVFTWPITLRNPRFDLRLPQHRRQVEAFRELAASYGLQLYCHPALFNLDLPFFYDRSRHLNRYGSIIRSENLADCLKVVIETGADPNISDRQAIETVRRREAEYRSRALALAGTAANIPTIRQP